MNVLDFKITDTSLPIVMVDDEPLDILCLQRYYEDSSLENPFMSFANGEEFLAYMSLVKNGTELMPAMVLLDINMPRMNGFEVLAAIRSDTAFDSMPVIAMLTSSTDNSDLKKAKDVGANEYFVKPYNAAEYAEFFAALT